MGIDWQAKVGQPCNAVFGDPGLYVPRDGSPVYLVNAVFDEGYKGILMIGDEAVTTDAAPVIGLNDWQNAGHLLWDQDDRIVMPVSLDGLGGYTIPAGARTFIVKESQPDGKGCTYLTLNKTAMWAP